MIYVLLIFMTTYFSLYHFISACKFHYNPLQFKIQEKGFSILVPCYNEGKIIERTINGLLTLDYKNLEVWFINDGSEDDTFSILQKKLKLVQVVDNNLLLKQSLYKSSIYSYIYVLNKENSGKALSLNLGLEYAKKELIITMDADCIFDPNALKLMNNTFLDKDIIASGGMVHTMQLFMMTKPSNLILRLQALDFIKGFYIYKSSLAFNNALTIISGAFGAFQRNVLLDLKGFHPGLGEDIDITIRMQEYAKKNGKKITYTPMSICYTECPESLSALIRQRVRWQKGFIDAIRKNYTFLLGGIIDSPTCFFLIVDALISNSVAVFLFCLNLVLIPLGLVEGVSIWSLVYFLLGILFQCISSIVAIKRARKYVTKLPINNLWCILLLDIVAYRFICIFYYIKGTLLYFFDTTTWDKIERTSNEYCKLTI